MLINTLELIIPFISVERKIPYLYNYLYNIDFPELNLNVLKQYLSEQQNMNNTFLNLVLSCTQEISEIPFNIMLSIIDTIKPYLSLFRYKYILTNGSLLKRENADKFNLINKDFIIKINRYSLDDKIDANFFNLNPLKPYSDFANFPNCKICFNIICLNNSSYDSIYNISNGLINKYKQVEELHFNTIKIYGTKINSVNIYDQDFNNWIIKFAYKNYTTINNKIQNLDEDIYKYIDIFTNGCRINFKQYSEWKYKNKRLIMNKPSNIQIRYNKNSIFYGSNLIDYDGNII